VDGIATIGQALTLVFNTEDFLNTLSAPQFEILAWMKKMFEMQEFALKTHQVIAAHIRSTLMTLSQPNFR
jgi:hypothetical protein